MKITTEASHERETRFAELALSDRQKDILHLLAKGKSNKEIAYDLGITEGTVKQHLFTLFKKIGVSNRTKAVLKAEELLKGYLTNPDNSHLVGAPVESELPTDYAWRMVTIVAISPKEVSSKEPGAIVRFDHALQKLRAETQALVSVLDGQMTTVPGGTIFAVFGAPKSHLDDAARGVFLAIRISAWLTKQVDLQGGIGIATVATLVGFSDDPIFRSDGFNLSQDLARHANNGQILATDPSCRAAGPSFNYIPYGPDDHSSRYVVKEVSAQSAPNLSLLANRFPLSFFSEIHQAALSNQAQWLSVEGWPPSRTTYLLDIFAAHCEINGYKTYRLRLATAGSPEQAAGNVFQQLKLVARLRERTEGNEVFLTAKTNMITAVSALEVLCMRGPTALVIYGLNSLDIIKTALGEKGIQKVADLPLMFITTAQGLDHMSYLKANILDMRANSSAVERSFKINSQVRPVNTDQIDVDLITMLDALTPLSRLALRTYVLSGKSQIAPGNQEIGQFVAKELLTSGLFRLVDDTLDYRNQAVKDALINFYQKSAPN